MEQNTKYYHVAGITIQVDSDLPIQNDTFHHKFNSFEVQEPGDDTIRIHHHFKSKPDLQNNLGEKKYETEPWIIYKNKGNWIYQFVPSGSKPHNSSFGVFNEPHTHCDVYWNDEEKTNYLNGNLTTLAIFPNDQVLLARVLADRSGCFFHSNGVVLDGKGYLFMGHSGYGKSTITRMLKGNGAKVLCDDRMIVRHYGENIKMHGNWCYGGSKEFSPDLAPLTGIFFISKSNDNLIIHETDKKKLIQQLLAYIVKPLVTADWWENNLNLLENIISETPCYNLMFDLSGDIIEKIKLLR